MTFFAFVNFFIVLFAGALTGIIVSIINSIARSKLAFGPSIFYSYIGFFSIIIIFLLFDLVGYGFTFLCGFASTICTIFFNVDDSSEEYKNNFLSPRLNQIHFDPLTKKRI